jgi:hypothetical protein
VGAKAGRRGDLAQVLAYAGGFGAAALLTYLFNAYTGRRLDASDFSAFAALLGVLLALTGASTALFGGGAMSAARTGQVPAMPWRRSLLAIGACCAVIGLVPLPPDIRATAWFGLAAVLLMAVAWARGLLIGQGRMGVAGATMVVEGFARIGFAALLVTLGLSVVGASAGLALGSP